MVSTITLILFSSNHSYSPAKSKSFFLTTKVKLTAIIKWSTILWWLRRQLVCEHDALFLLESIQHVGFAGFVPIIDGVAYWNRCKLIGSYDLYHFEIITHPWWKYQGYIRDDYTVVQRYDYHIGQDWFKPLVYDMVWTRYWYYRHRHLPTLARDRSTRWVSVMYASFCVTDNAQEMTKSLSSSHRMIGG